MSLEYKIDELTRNILLLSAKTEQRYGQSEQNILLGQNSLQQAEAVLARASQDIRQITAQVLQENLSTPVSELAQQCHVIGQNLKFQTDDAQKSYLQTLKTLKILIWTALAAFIAAALVCAVSLMFIFKSGSQQIRRGEWVEEINRAVESGVLNRCEMVHATVKSGLCVKIKNKWVAVR